MSKSSSKGTETVLYGDSNLIKRLEKNVTFAL